MRRLAAGVFPARRVSELRGVIEGQVDDLLGELTGDDVDLRSDLAYPLPIAVITALLGVPASDRGMFRRLAEALTVGAHYCLGAPLARLEAQVALPALLRRFPDLHLTARPVRRHRLTLRGWAALPATLGSVD